MDAKEGGDRRLVLPTFQLTGWESSSIAVLSGPFCVSMGPGCNLLGADLEDWCTCLEDWEPVWQKGLNTSSWECDWGTEEEEKQRGRTGIFFINRGKINIQTILCFSPLRTCWTCVWDRLWCWKCSSNQTWACLGPSAPPHHCTGS